MRILFRSASAHSPIGLDVGARHIKALQLEHGRGGMRVRAALMLPRLQEESSLSPTETRRLAQALDRAGFTGREAVVGVPQDKLLGSLLELPRAAGTPLEHLARMEVARSHRCAPDSFEVGCWEVPTPARSTRVAPVMAVACRHEDADALLEPLEQAGLDVIALDARACALARAASLLGGGSGGVTALLDLGWSAATLVLLYQGAVVYERKIAEAGMRKLHAAFQSRLHLDAQVADYLLTEAGFSGSNGEAPAPEDARVLLSAHVESLSAEASASFAYAAHQYADTAVERLLVCHWGAAVPGIAQRLGMLLNVPARTLAPADLAPCPASQRDACASPATLGAMGLAMYVN